MTYEEAKQKVVDYRDPVFGTRLIAVHRTPCDDGTEDCMVLTRCYLEHADCWYMHSCGFQLWLHLGTVEHMLPREGWNIQQISEDIILFSAVWPGRDMDIGHCEKHRVSANDVWDPAAEDRG